MRALDAQSVPERFKFMTDEPEKEIIPFDELPEELMHGLPLIR